MGTSSLINGDNADLQRCSTEDNPAHSGMLGKSLDGFLVVARGATTTGLCMHLMVGQSLGQSPHQELPGNDSVAEIERLPFGCHKGHGSWGVCW
jgi:hypothetical protein